MFKVKYVDSIMMLVRLDLNLIVSLFQHKCVTSRKRSRLQHCWVPLRSTLGANAPFSITILAKLSLLQKAPNH